MTRPAFSTYRGNTMPPVKPPDPPPAPTPTPPDDTATVPMKDWIIEKTYDSSDYLDRPEPKYEGGKPPA
jgi:hypothetical protein